MSLLPFNVVAGMAVRAFSIQVPVDDVVYETISGIDRRVPTGTRTIDAAVDPSGKRQLEQIFGGSVSDGDLAIWPEQGTENELYFPDQFDLHPTTEAETRKQSFLTYRGIRYRVIGVADYSDQADQKIYHATRHVAQDEAQ